MHYVIVNLTPERRSPSPRLHRTEVLNDRKDYVSEIIHDEDIAVAEAQRLATEKPTQVFAVMQVYRVFETTTPKVIEKGYNEAGELVLKSKG